ncbi:hypothetical protein A2858_02185 [Candidatus Daviesbacteria bacterium RIFCSPHIGHO2_01_FULL_36_37]|uniref:CopG antitoxin of type II toxin-antitoxin system n=3 Tax=Candidatus Daviesiibacteriota TaxID=1752718 RepID=A0A0G0F1H7_9BACT|nr:MAG: hypothetical protein US19_C0044G0012 [Candidatus Daviesbacteria bacterium GW2011_GWB1_36_5]OGE16632.1 MAG: hypothetical protein A2858_02185 [Candidatus Daviesbacteria bacterium RIFCSPHIGHO2_01_FULL_36_37]OGE33370.1 MAG: hypothetical protein A3C99_01615 [Candidatus Daviesbacteria bacterium RIFCSPHIGHO2_02_FULL_37_9]OGE34715.1 MAG: hypothetical protein A3E66_03745 [Candidatus Daviesbacteria bacterium RIFCSPHIGHO2_12_FULL_37_16]
MPKKKNKLPNFNKMTYEEEAHFWDTHDITDYEDETEEVEIIFDLKKPREKIVPIRMQAELRDRLDQIARSKGLNLSTLIRMWLMEKLQSPRS